MALIHNKSGISSRSPYYKLFLFGLACLVIYFIWMDIALFVNLQRWQPPPIYTNQTTRGILAQAKPLKNIDPFSTFNPLTVKLIMIDHMTHYVHDISARFLVDYMGLARLFYWMSANCVSFIGLFMAFVGSVLTISDNLMYRQLGALLFECRNIADSLDGVFSRARKREHAEFMRKNQVNGNTPDISFSSTYGTVGYNVDIICDIIGGAFFCAAIFYRFLRRPPQKQIQSTTKLPIKYTKLMNDEVDNDYPIIKVMNKATTEDTLQFKPSKVSDSVKEAFSSAESSPKQASSRRHFSHREVKLMVISFGLRILLTGYLWDHFVHKYHDLLMVFSENPTQRKMQGEAFRSISMWLVMWFWRLANGCALLEHLVYATFFDKLWDYIVLTTYIGWGYLVILTMITQIHYTELYNSLNRLSSFM